MIYPSYLYETCYFYIESEDTFYKKQSLTKNNETLEKIVLQKCSHDEINTIVDLMKPTKEIVHIIKYYLDNVHSSLTRTKKIEFCIELFEFLVKYVGFVHRHPHFKETVEKKLKNLDIEPGFPAKKYYELIFKKPLQTHASLYQVTDISEDSMYLKSTKSATYNKMHHLENQFSKVSLKKLPNIHQHIYIHTKFSPTVQKPRKTYHNPISQPFNVFKQGCPNNCHYCPLHSPVDYMFYDAPYLKIDNWNHRPRWFQEEDMILSRREIDIILDKNYLASDYWSQNSEIVFNYLEQEQYKKSHPNSIYEATAIFHTKKKSWSGIRKIIYS